MKLADWRRRKGWTQQQLADALDCVLPTVARYEGGTRIPESPPSDDSRDMMKRIFILTEGEVRPDDFYNIPRWEAELIAAAGQAELDLRAA